MERRKFLSLGTLAAVAVVVPTANAEDFRKTKPTVWTAHTVDDAVMAMYGTKATTESGVTVTMPDVAANGGAVPVNVKSSIDAKSVALFQNANPESAVAAWTIHEGSIIDYDLKIKLKSDGTPITVTAIVEGKDGKLYSGVKTLTVALGGCEG
ncbi:thiosulfate oxidation carrier protein SoxY [Campylobacterota bacterium]